MLARWYGDGTVTATPSRRRAAMMVGLTRTDKDNSSTELEVLRDFSLAYEGIVPRKLGLVQYMILRIGPLTQE